MCGLSGCLVFNNSNLKITEEYLVSMSDTMVNRGPNGGMTWLSSDSKIGLSHRRLSIIDLSQAANQPFCNEDESVIVVFNGEIYNHLEIKNELQELGSNIWKTSHSDTEVILRAYEKWGIECINKFRGDFAIGVWDVLKQELYLIRDRAGVKPLYYTIFNGRLLFASEIKAIIEDKEIPREVNEEGLFHYLTFLTVQAPQTLFKNIYKIAAGTYLKFDRNGHKTECVYYDVLNNINENVNKLDDNELSKQILNQLRISVKYRQVGDVPVGVFLSGGIDSSTNTALFSENSDNVRTFSIGYDADYNSYTNELNYAQLVAKKFNANYQQRILSEKDLINFLPKMIELQDEPLADPVCIPVYFVSELARKNGIIVCQVGEGADELFFGYPSWGRILYIHKLNQLPIPKIFKRIVKAIMKKFNLESSVYYEYLQRALSNQPIFWSGSEAFTDIQKKKILSDRLIKKYDNVTSFSVIEPYWRNYKNKGNERDFINWMGYMDLNLRLPELLLMRVDKMSMGVSLEARVPFLDHKVVELAMSIHGDRKYKNQNYKYLLKNAVRGLIPQVILNRSKQGFGAPIEDWYQKNLGKDAYNILKKFTNETDYFNWSEIENILQSNQASKTWPLLNFALWWNRFIKTAD